MLLTSTASEVTSTTQSSTTQSSTTTTVTEVQRSPSTTPESSATTKECIDKHELCPVWARFGECDKNAEFMTDTCMLSCGLCAGATRGRSTTRSTTTPMPTTTTATTTTRACVDTMGDDCKLWARTGQCEGNPEYMNENCPVSCGVCGTLSTSTTAIPCFDESESCSLWAETGQCEENPEYMMNNCMISCGVCAGPNVTEGTVVVSTTTSATTTTSAIPTTTTTSTTSTTTPTTTTKECIDASDQCPVWARFGQCEENPSYMFNNCLISCGVCAGPTLNTTTTTAGTTSNPSTTTSSTTAVPTTTPVTTLKPDTATTSTTTAAPTTTTITTTTTTRPCVDVTEECTYWAESGQCEENPSYMLNNCLISCGVCESPTLNTTSTTAGTTSNLSTTTSSTTAAPTTTTSTTTAPTTTTIITTTTARPCVDETEECAYWAESGQCEENPSYMLNNCLISCGVCAGPTVNTTDATTASTSTTQKLFTATTSSTTAIPTTTTATTTTRACVDESDSCPIWAQTGQCEMNPEYMLNNCLISCGVCAGPTLNTTTSTTITTPKPSTTTTSSTTAIPTTTTVTTTTTTKACLDASEDCPLWARTGQCEENPSYMLANCLISCGVCVVESNDTTSSHQATTPGENSRWFGCPVCVHNIVPICVRV